jgi:hypothetical protein
MPAGRPILGNMNHTKPQDGLLRVSNLSRTLETMQVKQGPAAHSLPAMGEYDKAAQPKIRVKPGLEPKGAPGFQAEGAS